MFVLRQSERLSRVRFLRLEGKPSDEELSTYLDAQREIARTTVAKAAVTILEISHVWTAKQRKMMKAFEDEFVDQQDLQLGMARG